MHQLLHDLASDTLLDLAVISVPKARYLLAIVKEARKYQCLKARNHLAVLVLNVVFKHFAHTVIKSS